MAADPVLTTPTCCGAQPSRRSILQHALQSASWIIPGSLLALMPKCPICLAGYIALGTGLGISASAATHLRTAIITLCIAWLALQVFRKCSIGRTSPRLGRF